MPQNDYKAYADELYVKYNGLVEEYNKLLGKFNAILDSKNYIEKKHIALKHNYNNLYAQLESDEQKIQELQEALNKQTNERRGPQAEYAKFMKLKQRSDELEEKLIAAENKLKEYEEEYNRLDDKLDKLLTEKVELEFKLDSVTAENKRLKDKMEKLVDEKTQQQIDSFAKDKAEYVKIITELNSRIESLEQQLRNAENDAQAEIFTADRFKRYEGKTDTDEIALRIALSQDYTDGIAESRELVFLKVKGSGDKIVLAEEKNYRQAPFICFGDQVTLNPFYYSDFPADGESYANIEQAKAVFDVSGVSIKEFLYSLDYITPAAVKAKNGELNVSRRGKMAVKIVG